MTKTLINILIVYDEKMEMPETSALFDRIKGCLGNRPVSGFHFDAMHDDEIPE